MITEGKKNWYAAEAKFNYALLDVYIAEKMWKLVHDG